MAEIDTQALPLLPLTTGVVLPGMVVTLTIESDEARAATRAPPTADGVLLLVPRLDGRYARIGTVAKVEDIGQLRSGMEAVVIRGLHRAAVGVGDPRHRRGHVGPDRTGRGRPGHASARPRWRASTARWSRTSSRRAASRRSRSSSAASTDPGTIADTAGYSPDLSFEQKIEVLETTDVEARLEMVLGWAKDTLADLELKDKIRTEVSEGMEKRQREFLLREQMSAIRKELGEDGEENVVEEYRRKIEAAGMPEDVRKEAERELGRLERTSEQSPEYGWIRTYLDWMIELPWSVRTDDNLEIPEARARPRRRPRGARRT